MFRVRLSVSLSVCLVSCGKTADWIRMPFGMVGRVGPENHQLVGVQTAQQEWAVWGMDMGQTIVTYD